MKNYYSQLLLFTFLLIQAYSHAQIIPDPHLRLVEVNKSINSFNPLDTIPNIKGVIPATPDYSEFDQINNHYLVKLKDTSNQDRLFTLDANTGAVISNPALPVLATGDDIFEYQLDNSTGVLYGLYRVRNSPQGRKQCLVSINKSTGAYTIIDTINGVTSIDYYQGHTVFDSKQGHYIFKSENSGQPHRLYSIDVTNGNVVNNPLFPVLSDSNDVLTHLEFDDSTGTIFGLLWDESLQAEYLVSVDPVTGFHTLIDSIPGLKRVSPLSHRVTFDPVNSWYIFQGQEANQLGYLYTIDANDASIVSKRPFDINTNPDSIPTPYYLHAQHSTGKLLGLTWMSNKAASVEELAFKNKIKVYPNPSKGIFQLEFGNKDFSKKQVEVFDVTANIVFQKVFNELNTNSTLDLSHLEAGVYFVKLSSNSTSETVKVLIVD